MEIPIMMLFFLQRLHFFLNVNSFYENTFLKSSFITSASLCCTIEHVIVSCKHSSPSPALTIFPPPATHLLILQQPAEPDITS
uniref:Uncharacterized protein n=1 Tax=Octopus bimaculoides TaxID=37653 RepID=A0A0L8H1M7_OCTBM